MDDIITIIIYLLILIFGAIAGSKKKKRILPQQIEKDKSVKPSVTLEEILKELGVPIEENEKEILQPEEINAKENQKDITLDSNIYKTEFKNKEKEYSYSKYETLEKIEDEIKNYNEIQNLEVIEPATITSEYITEKANEPYNITQAYNFDEHHIARTEIKSENNKEKVIENEFISFLIKNPQSLIIYSDILKSKYF